MPLPLDYNVTGQTYQEGDLRLIRVLWIKVPQHVSYLKDLYVCLVGNIVKATFINHLQKAKIQENNIQWSTFNDA